MFVVSFLFLCSIWETTSPPLRFTPEGSDVLLHSLILMWSDSFLFCTRISLWIFFFVDKIAFFLNFKCSYLVRYSVFMYMFATCKVIFFFHLPAECQPLFNGPEAGQRGRQKICSSLLWGRGGRGTDRLCCQQIHDLNTRTNIKAHLRSKFPTLHIEAFWLTSNGIVTSVQV